MEERKDGKKINIDPFKTRYKKNEYFNVIRKRLIEKKINENTFLSMMGLERKSFFSNFTRLDKEQIPFRKIFIEKLCPLVDLHPDLFLVSEKNEEKFKVTFCKEAKIEGVLEPMKKVLKIYVLRENINQVYLGSMNSNIIVKTIPLISHKENNTELIDFYRDISSRYLEAEKIIVCHEVLFKGNNNNPNKYIAYRKAQNHILEAIHQSLDKGIIYKRLFYLSPSNSIHSKNYSDSNNLFKIMMIESSFETLIHIKTCIEHDNRDNIEFYVSPFSRFRAQTKIDDSLLITEDYKRHYNYIMPNLIFLDNIGSDTNLQVMSTDFDKELDEKEDKQIYLMDLDSFELYLNSARDYLENLITKRENFIKIINNIIAKKKDADFDLNDLDSSDFIDSVLFMKNKVNGTIQVLQNQLFDLNNKIELISNSIDK